MSAWYEKKIAVPRDLRGEDGWEAQFVLIEEWVPVSDPAWDSGSVKLVCRRKVES